MGLVDELRKLQDLRNSGALTEEEFAKAKAALLDAPPPAPAPEPDYEPPPRPRADALGEAAKTWVNFQIGAAIVGLILAAIFFFAFFLPNWNRAQDKHEQFDRDFQRRQQEFDKEWNKTRQEQEEFRKRHFPNER